MPNVIGASMIPLWSLPLAVGAGNTFVLKPSERTTGASLIIAECVVCFFFALELNLFVVKSLELLGKLVRGSMNALGNPNEISLPSQAFLLGS